MGLARLFDPSKVELESLYQFHSCQKIGKMHGVNAETVRKRLHEHGIDTQKVGGRRAFNPSKEVLSDLYQTMSMRQIADKFEVGETVVWKRLHEHGITLKDHENGGHRLKVGRVFSEAHKANLAASKRGKTGAANPNWKGGVTIENLKIRLSPEAIDWKKQVLKLRGNACQGCGAKRHSICECCGTKVNLHVHHIKSFAKHPELRFDVTNAEVLCPKCHFSRHH